eukprot:scaffold50460_cov79-Cyclotella_meneghiniana.AAC.2
MAIIAPQMFNPPTKAFNFNRGVACANTYAGLSFIMELYAHVGLGRGAQHSSLPYFEEGVNDDVFDHFYVEGRTPPVLHFVRPNPTWPWLAKVQIFEISPFMSHNV